MDELKKNALYLKVLHQLPSRQRNNMLKKAPNSLIKVISQCSYNVLKGNVKLNNIEKRKLKKYKKSLRELSKKRASLKKKREMIMKGGFLGALIGPVLAGLGGSLIKGIIGSFKR